MGLASIISNALATADIITADLQPVVSFEAWIGNDGAGGNTYAAAIPTKAIVENKMRLMRDTQGEDKETTHLITIIRPIAPNGAANRSEPIDPRDRFTLPDGSTGPIIAIEGLINRATNAPFFAQIWLGKKSGK